MRSGSEHCYVQENKTISTSALGPTAANLVNEGIDCVMIVITTDQPVSYRIDGGTPTATLGLLVPANGRAVINGFTSCRNLLLIRNAASDANVNFAYHK